jgi:hypothetical protein
MSITNGRSTTETDLLFLMKPMSIKKSSKNEFALNADEIAGISVILIYE